MLVGMILLVALTVPRRQRIPRPGTHRSRSLVVTLRMDNTFSLTSQTPLECLVKRATLMPCSPSNGST